MATHATALETAPPRDEAVYTDIVNTYLDDIYSYAVYMLGDSMDADDIVQQTFVSLYQQLPKLHTEVSVKPWLFTVARNKCLDFIKKKKPVLFSEISDDALDIPSEDASIEAQMDSEQFTELVLGYIHKLPVAYRDVLVCKITTDDTFETIAQDLGQPVNTVKSNFYRGKKLLYMALKGEVR